MILLTTLLIVPPAHTAQDAPSPWFREIAAASGLKWTHDADRTDRFRFPEIMGGGVALFDYDGDGDLDVYLVQGGKLVRGDGEADLAGNRLFRNDTAKGEFAFVDVTGEAGVGDTGYGMGAACGDFDRDGDVDLFVTNVGPNVLYVNDGDGTFTRDTRKMKGQDPRWGTSAAFFDASGNGKLDLYVVNNLAWSDSVETECVNYYQERDYCSPNNYNSPAGDVLYTYGRLGFTDSTSKSGVEQAFGNGLGLAVGDYDLDGDTDVYIANDATKNVLWSNEGRARFENTAKLGGCEVSGSGRPEAGMGVQFVDMDDDGDLDLYMTHLRRETNTYYRNRKGLFSDMSNTVGTNSTSLRFTGFGMGVHDFDLDGALDLFVANGAVQAWKENERFVAGDPYAEPNHIFRGKRTKRGVRFSLVQPEGVTADDVHGTSRGSAFGDLDGDGDLDVIVVDLDGPVKLYENIAPAEDANWVGFRAVEGRKNADVHGATISIRRGEDARTYRQANPAYSYLSSNDPRAHFGLGAETVARDVRVRWPDGSEQSFGDLPAGQYHVLKRER